MSTEMKTEAVLSGGRPSSCDLPPAPAKSAAPSVVVWGVATGVPLLAITSPHPMEWGFWLLCAASWCVIGGWLYKRAREKKEPTPVVSAPAVDSVPLATVGREDVYWTMYWGQRKEDGTRRYPDKPETEMVFEDAPALAVLLANEALFLNAYWWRKDWPEDARKVTALCVNCNDIFAWGCADAEDLEYSELQDLYDHWQKDPRNGVAVWCCKKRGQLPQAPVLKDIVAGGLWDMDSLGLRPNGYDAACRERRLKTEPVVGPGTQSETR